MESLEIETPNFQTQQNLNLENSEIETSNIQLLPNQNNQNSNLINQLDLSPIIVINLPPVEPIGQPLQQPHQQIQQPLVPLQQPLQPNLDPMAYAPIAKLEKFTGEEDDNDTRTMQVILYFLKDTADSWYHSLAQKPQNFNAFKLKFLRYFSNNNSINCLASTFTTIKQKDTKAVTTYLRCFHRNLCQIQAIQADYFIAPQILNQFIQGLCIDLPTAMTHARDFEAAKLEASHAQAVNLVMNRSSNLDFKLKQFSDNINQKLESYLQHTIGKSLSKPRLLVSDFKLPIQSRAISKHLPVYDAATNLSANNISTTNLLAAATKNLLITATSYLLATASSNLSTPTSSNAAPKLSYNDQNSGIGSTQNPNSQNYLSLLVILEDITFNNPELDQQPTILTNNISPAIVTNNELLTAIFLETALEEKLITAMYTNVKVNGHFIKLILNSAVNARIITVDGATKTPIGKIDDFLIEVNDIITPIKVLVMEATQYQALMGNNWLSKNNAILD
ncbi:hypothetical protein G9A89_012335 [Geosiphon pyriformis]|nr:hypothetical protein G9A89_012335 [Geosiphon pyriformis]